MKDDKETAYNTIFISHDFTIENAVSYFILVI